MNDPFENGKTVINGKSSQSEYNIQGQSPQQYNTGCSKFIPYESMACSIE